MPFWQEKYKKITFFKTKKNKKQKINNKRMVFSSKSKTRKDNKKTPNKPSFFFLLWKLISNKRVWNTISFRGSFFDQVTAPIRKGERGRREGEREREEEETKKERKKRMTWQFRKSFLFSSVVFGEFVVVGKKKGWREKGKEKEGEKREKTIL